MQKKFEFILYLMVGVATTGVNYAVYTLFLQVGVQYLPANGLAWCAAVAASYAMNRRWVFGSKWPVVPELAAFAGARLLTLGVESVCLYGVVSRLGLPPLPAKVIVSVVTVVGNYLLCKYKVFARGKQHGSKAS